MGKWDCCASGPAAALTFSKPKEEDTSPELSRHLPACPPARPPACLQARSVGNSAKLKQTALVEAFNLRAAVELQLGNPAGE
jgi:hypothetical protein